jgi:Leu/Phe-tRNA-protein transferase
MKHICFWIRYKLKAIAWRDTVHIPRNMQNPTAKHNYCDEQVHKLYSNVTNIWDMLTMMAE